MQSTASTPCARAAATISSTARVSFTPVIRPTQPTTNAPAWDPVRAPVVLVRGGVAEALLERDAEPDDCELLARRNSELHELVPDLGADRDEHVGRARERLLDAAEDRRSGWTEVALEDVSVKGVDDDGRARVAGEDRRRAGDRAGLRRVRVEDVRTLAPDQRRYGERRAHVVDRRHLALDRRDADDRHSEPLREEGHRVLATREASGDERGLVTARLEPGRQVGDVDRRPAHVEARDDAEDADRPGCHEG